MKFHVRRLLSLFWSTARESGGAAERGKAVESGGVAERGKAIESGGAAESGDMILADKNSLKPPPT